MKAQYSEVAKSMIKASFMSMFYNKKVSPYIFFNR